ncbi:MAG: exosortase T [Rhodospirillaceae bacterium]
MKPLAPRTASQRLSILGFATASAILALEPLRWLIQTWQDPSYETSGWIYGVLLAGLILWALSAPRLTPRNTRAQRTAALLLLVAALLRLISQIAAINIIGGMALALDVYALLTWLGLAERKRAVSPFWLSVLFLFTLPFERVVQRLLGYPMQEVSAFGACQMLTPFFSELLCEGVRLKVAGIDVLVDLPCSGTSGLMITLALVTALNALWRPSLMRALGLFGLAIMLAILGNAVRIALLATGLVYEPLTGIDVMAPLPHDLLGYATLLLFFAPVLWLYGPTPAQVPPGPSAPSTPAASWAIPSRTLPILSVGFVGLALVIVSLPRQALDVSRPTTPIALPQALNGVLRQFEPLTARERTYFEQFGGGAQKALYGPLAMTVVQTTSPLRHLHAPDDCLRGLGYRVTFVGTRFEPIPTSLYKAEDAQGQAWLVAVTYANGAGFATSNVAEAIWQWLQAPNMAWHSIQRITPWTLPDLSRDRFENAAVAALDLAPNP